MLKNFYASLTYLILGLGSGLFYREFTKARGVDEGQASQLGLAHTHLLTLGFIVFLVVLALDQAFTLSNRRSFTWFFWTYNAGVLLTSAMLITHGTMTILGIQASAAISGIAGLGHILITVGTVFLFVRLGSAVRAAQSSRSARPSEPTQPSRSA